jgi:uncharacterized OB-fold protein
MSVPHARADASRHRAAAGTVIQLHGFFEQARDGWLTAVRCRACGHLAMPPRDCCRSCRQRSWEPTRLSGAGTITSYRVVAARPPAPHGLGPYAVAAVRLAEGLSLRGRLVDIPLERLAVGLAVRFRPLVHGGYTAVGFGPD